MSDPSLRFLPGKTESVVLIGAIAPPQARPGKTLLITSPVSEREFDEDDREGLRKFARIQSLDDAGRALESIGGQREDLDSWIESGLLARLPASTVPSSCLELLTGFALVWLTGGMAAAADDEHVLLAPPEGDGAVKISPLLYAVLQHSDGSVDFPSMLREATANDPERLDELVAEVVVKLRFLVNNGIVALVRAA